MIVPKTPQIKRMVQYVGFPLLGLIFWDVVIVLAFKVLHWEWIGSKNVPLALYGSAIGIIVGFRNNSAYARWWEARTLWGSIVNNSRSLARQVCATLHYDPAKAGADEAEIERMKRRIVHGQIAFVHALRLHLRGQEPLPKVYSLLESEDHAALNGQKNVSLAIQRHIGILLRDAHRNGWINQLEWQAMDRNLDDLMDAQGGAERIKNTPLPKQYDFFPMLFVQMYCVLLPIGMVENLGWFTPLGSTLVGFMLLALDKIGRDLEDPFDNTIYDVPLTSITTTIEINLRQLLGETELPAPETPVNGILW
jgi:ion channel-forming bestrophin family protein